MKILGTVFALMLLSTGLAANERGRDGHLNILYWQAPSILNPYLSSGTKDIDASSLVLEPLALFDDTGNLVPRLAQSVPTLSNGGITADLKSITWKLRPGLVWSDGSPVTAEDVVFTAEYCRDPSGGCAQLARFDDVTSIAALDDLTVKVTYSVPKAVSIWAFRRRPVTDPAGCTVCLLQGCEGTTVYRGEFRADRHGPVSGDGVSLQRRHLLCSQSQLSGSSKTGICHGHLQGRWERHRIRPGRTRDR